jgi:hypothetical protein
MHYPIDIKRSLETCFTFPVCVGPPAKGSISPTKGTIEPFAVVGMDVFVLEILHSVWMLRLGRLIFGALWSFFMRLRSLVLHPDLYPFFESFTGTTLFAVQDQFMANIEQDISISALAIRNQGEVLRLVNELFQCPQSFFEKLAIFPAASEFPKKTAGPVHEYDCPTQGRIGGSILSDFCIDLVAFYDELEIGMKQSIEKQCLFDSSEAGFPSDKSVLRHTKGSARGIESKSFGSGLDHLNYNAQRFSDAGKEGVAGFGKESVTVNALVDCSLAGAGGFISGMFFISGH